MKQTYFKNISGLWFISFTAVRR